MGDPEVGGTLRRALGTGEDVKSLFSLLPEKPDPRLVPVPGKRPQFPIFIPSRGRAKTGKTAHVLRANGLPFTLVVEPQEVEEYVAEYGRESVAVLPASG